MSVKIPIPSFVNVPDPLAIAARLNVVFPAPPTVRAIPGPVNPPVKVRVPRSEFMRDATLNVTAPDQKFVPLIFLKAPSELMPLPLSAKGSAPTEIPPCSSRAAPEATVTPPAIVPVPWAF